MKYYLWVLGCAMNYSDAERIATVLDLLGYTKTEKETEADLIITVACSVRQTAIDRIYGKARAWRERKKKNTKLKIILTGCVLDKDKKRMSEIFDVIVPIENIGNLPVILDKMKNLDSSTLPKDNESTRLKINNLDLNKNLKFKIKNYENDYFAFDAKYESTFRAFVPIMTGCDNFCTYCAVPYTRGREKSRKAEEILAEISSLVRKGYKEITLLGQNVNSYGLNQKSNIKDEKHKGKIKNKFVELLKEIDRISGDFRVYFYSNHPKDMSDVLIETLPKLKHFPKYIHLPLQSGSNTILRAMNRHYTQKQYLELMAKIKKAMPDVVLTTDIIVGFPGETKKDFNETKKVMEKVGFDMAYIAQYSPRPGTQAAKLKDNVTKNEKVQREKVLVSVLEKTALKNNLKLKNSTQKVLVDGFKNGKYYGRTEGYKVVEVIIQNRKDEIKKIEIGNILNVTIIKAEAWKLIGTLI